jgi:hypothetical protein
VNNNMNDILLKNELGESVTAKVLKIFKYNDEIYMLYTLNEIDPSNYIKLYGVKLTMNPSTNQISASMIDDSVWGSIVSLIKEMVKPVQERTNNNFIDLDSRNLTSVDLISKRIFKINKDMADLIVKNSTLQQKTTSNSNQPVQSVQPVQPVQSEQTINTSNMVASSMETQANLNVEATQASTGQIPSSQNNLNQNQVSQELDYKVLYEEQTKNIETLMQEINNLKNKLSDIENILKG